MQKTYKCDKCSGVMEYAADVQGLKCPYCGNVQPMPQELNVQVIQELDFNKALSHFESMQTTEVKIVKCPGCQAEVTFSPNVTSGACDFCGTQIVAEGTATKAMEPQYVVPFQLTKEQASGKFKTWIKKLWFAPNALKKMARISEPLKGIYYPFWTYDSQTETDYTGERGEHYTVQVQRKNSDGTTSTVNETRTRWYPARGHVSRFFDDVLINASRSLPDKLTKRLKDWNLKNLVEYNSSFLSGYKAESYSVGLQEGFESAKDIMEDTITSDVRHQIGGDEQRIHSMTSQFLDIKFKYLLLPIWTVMYRFGKKYYQVLVNAQTGEVQGDRPYSVIKIVLAILGVAALAVGGYLLYKYFAG